MRIEFIPWSANMEIQLRDDDGSVIDRFYTVNREFSCETSGADVEFDFHAAETILGPPEIGGPFAAHHLYWHERKARQAARAAKLGLTQ